MSKAPVEFDGFVDLVCRILVRSVDARMICEAETQVFHQARKLTAKTFNFKKETITNTILTCSDIYLN